MNDVWILRNDFFSLMIDFLEINAAVLFVVVVVCIAYFMVYIVLCCVMMTTKVFLGWNECEGNYQKCGAKLYYAYFWRHRNQLYGESTTQFKHLHLQHIYKHTYSSNQKQHTVIRVLCLGCVFSRDRWSCVM